MYSILHTSMRREVLVQHFVGGEKITCGKQQRQHLTWARLMLLSYLLMSRISRTANGLLIKQFIILVEVCICNYSTKKYTCQYISSSFITIYSNCLRLVILFTFMYIVDHLVTSAGITSLVMFQEVDDVTDFRSIMVLTFLINYNYFFL